MRTAIHTALVLTSIVGLTLVGPHQTAEACGLKLSVKTSKVKRPVKPSENPSRILILGPAPSKVRSMLSSAGHQVENAKKTQPVRGKDFQLILVANKTMEAEAQRTWPDAKVMQMRSSPRRNLASVERELRRAPTNRRVRDTPVRTKDQAGDIVAAGPDRPVAASPRAEVKPAKPAEPVKAAEPAKPAPRPAVAMAPKPRKVEPKAAPEPVPQPKPAAAEPVKAAAPAAADRPVAKTAPTELAIARRTIPTAMTTRVAPRKMKPTRKPGKTIKASSVPKYVFFSVASHRVRSRDRRRLARAIRYLNQNEGSSINLTGHADSRGPSEFNLDLGQQRADAVRKYLMDKGVDESRIQAISTGEEQQPFNPGTSYKNRCVTIELK